MPNRYDPLMRSQQKVSQPRLIPPQASDQDLTIVFAPGLSCDERLWDKTRALLPGRSCITVDLAHQTSLEGMAAEILKVAAVRFILVGFSMGAMATLIAAANAPHRVAGLLVVSTHGEPDTADRLAARKRQLALAGTMPFDAYVRDELLPGYFRDQVSDTDAALLADMALRLGPKIFARQVKAIMTRPDLVRAANLVRCPTIVMTGKYDTLAPPLLSASLASNVIRAKFMVVPGCGHALPLERPSAVADAVGQLCSRALSRGYLE